MAKRMSFDGTRLVGSLASFSPERILAYAANERNDGVIRTALRIRAVEGALIDLFGKGKLHGTIHTCVGQEFVGAAVGACLADGDFVTSNHRCHGHFIGATGNWRGLIDEIVGNIDGVCAGIGSSQHLRSENFLSNGQQGGLLPVGAGIALDRKRNQKERVVVSFVGEGTLGEGVIYETMNIDSLWGLPHLLVCENNFYSQSTPQPRSVAGDIAARPAAFGIAVRKSSTWNPAGLEATVADAFAQVRKSSRPLFLVIETYRLNPHSKGDDERDVAELDWFRARDPLNVILREHNVYRMLFEELTDEVAAYLQQALIKPKTAATRYFTDQLPRIENREWRRCTDSTDAGRLVQQLNAFYANYLASDQRSYFLGEDIDDPYGGTFKVSKGFSSQFPGRVITTPISEAAIVGVGIGLAVSGNRPLVEIMFGDFTTLAFDQIVNNAAKFFHMYDQQVSVPLVVRTPMGGRRGYGPTHSQSLERFFIGIDNVLVISLNSLVDVGEQLAGLIDLAGPAILFENKIDYTMRTFRPPPGFAVEIGDARFPAIRVKPDNARADVTIVSYGGMARIIADNLVEIFDEADVVPELLVPTALHPIDVSVIEAMARATGWLMLVEEGSGFGSLGAEIAARIAERTKDKIRVSRISGEPVPVPSVPELEAVALPGVARICRELRAAREI
jgi:2-oxoisovalerate dehydrogenase E1 component